MVPFNDFMRVFESSRMSEYCASHGELVRYRRGERFAQEGYLCRYVGFVKEGYFRFCSLSTSGEECVTGFSFAGEFVADYVRSFASLRPSLCSIVAGCDSVVLRVPLPAIRQYIIDNEPGLFEQASSVLMEAAYRRYIEMHTMTPAERYAALLNRFPAMSNKLSVSEVASFLGISRRHLHRIAKGRVK